MKQQFNEQIVTLSNTGSDKTRQYQVGSALKQFDQSSKQTAPISVNEIQNNEFSQTNNFQQNEVILGPPSHINLVNNDEGANSTHNIKEKMVLSEFNS